MVAAYFARPHSDFIPTEGDSSPVASRAQGAQISLESFRDQLNSLMQQKTDMQALRAKVCWMEYCSVPSAVLPGVCDGLTARFALFS